MEANHVACQSFLEKEAQEQRYSIKYENRKRKGPIPNYPACQITPFTRLYHR
jgi:hypothetical protein